MNQAARPLSAAMLATGLLLLTSARGEAQVTSDQATLAEAARLRDAGRLADAVNLLRPYVERRPDDVPAARVLAETLYWLKDVQGARTVYEAALDRAPHDPWLRLQYGRMLMETGDPHRTRQVVAPVLSMDAARGPAETLLGTLAYWQGDWVVAKRRFLAALRADSGQQDARRQLREIASATAPWVRFSSDLRHDDQPLDRLGATVEAGWYPSPLSTIVARIQPWRFQPGDSAGVDVRTGELALSHLLPRARVDLEAALGAVWRGDQGGTDWTGRLKLGLHVGPGIVLRLHGDRVLYLNTISSLATPVMTRGVGGVFDWSGSHGWLAQATFQRQWYPDANALTAAYAWMLAPIAHRRAVQLQLGYSLAGQNADESRFVLAYPLQPYAPGNPLFNTAGRYAPYYTPSNLVAHAIIGAAMLQPKPVLVLRMNGSYGLHATDDSPFFRVSSGPSGLAVVELATSRRTFSPWTARATLEATPGRAVALAVTGEASRTAAYRMSMITLQVSYRFADAALRRVERY